MKKTSWIIPMISVFLIIAFSCLGWSDDQVIRRKIPTASSQDAQQPVQQDDQQSVQEDDQQSVQEDDQQPAQQDTIEKTVEPNMANKDLTIQGAVVCEKVMNRNPVGSSDIFSAKNEKLFCFTQVVGAITDTYITHNWYYQGSLQSSVELPVRSSNWRTWSSKIITPELTGEWMVEILSEEGSPLENIVFFVQ
ncbi:MAG: DUF2914 domain-containing protein [Desulfobacteraceae bacterium]|nr:DUF2914 domain-containing protein [Desulfobacteraceae bacterium]